MPGNHDDENNGPSTPTRSRLLVVSLTPNASPNTMYTVARKLQLQASQAQEETETLKRKIADLENGQDDPETRKKRRDADEDEDDSEKIEQALITEVTRLGRKCVIEWSMWLWLPAKKMFEVKLSEDYVERERWENSTNKIEGQARMLRDLFPESFHGDSWGQAWLVKAFKDGLTSQLSNTSTRLRGSGSGATSLIFGGEAAEFIKEGEAKRLEMFREEIGWKEPQGGKPGYYSTFDVPILHANFASTFEAKEAFLNPVLLKMYATLLRGPSAANGLMTDKWLMPKTEVMQTTAGIHHTTPGAIAGCCVLVRWTLSQDSLLQPLGGNSRIDYQADYDKYLHKITQDLRLKKKWALSLFREWDRIIFRNANSKLGGSKAQGTQKLQDEEEERVLGDENESEEEEEVPGCGEGGGGGGDGTEGEGEGGNNGDQPPTSRAGSASVENPGPSSRPSPSPSE